MLVKFNPSGTHIHKGYLKVRIDLYPEPVDKTYTIHYVDEVDDEGQPTGQKKVNPCLCHFIKVDKNISLPDFQATLAGHFDTPTKLELDNALSVFDTPRVTTLMKTKLGDGQPVTKFTDGDRKKLNQRLAPLEIKV